MGICELFKEEVFWQDVIEKWGERHRIRMWGRRKRRIFLRKAIKGIQDRGDFIK